MLNSICVLEHPRMRSEKHFNDIANAPLWSCLLPGYVAASLENVGFEVRYLDAARRQWSFKRVVEEVMKSSPGLLLVNAVYIWEHTEKVFNFLEELRNTGFAGHISLFGFFPTLAYQDILSHFPFINSVMVGECEDTCIELAKNLEAQKPLDQIMGLALPNPNGPFLMQRRKPASNPDRFPFPRRVTDANQTAGILASRGCYNHCRFCPVPSFYHQGPLWIGRTPENVFHEIEKLAAVGYRDFYFIDPNFIGPGKSGKDRIFRLMDLIGPLKITFGMETRPNDLDADILESMVAAGLTSLLMGIESGSKSVLKKLDKKSSLAAGSRAIRLCREAGLEPEIGFLMFTPDGGVSDLADNFRFLMDNDLLNRLDRTVNLVSHYQIVLNGASGYQKFQNENRLTPTGFLGFEGEVSYLDDRSHWISKVVIPVCRCVLENIEKPDSPLFWGAIYNKHKSKANDFLIDFFESAVVLAQSPGVLPAPVQLIEKTIKNFAGEILGQPVN